MVIVLSVALVIVTVWILWTARAGPAAGAVALATWLGVVVAPKNSLWNFTPLLLCLCFAWPSLRSSRRLLGLTVLALAAIEEQGIVNSNRDSWFSTPLLTWISSLALYGALVLGSIVAYLLLRSTVNRPLAR